MRSQNVIGVFLFCVFCGIGVAAVGVSILCDELIGYYHDKQLREQAEDSSAQLKSLIADHDVLLDELQKDPNFVKRIAAATLGTAPADANTIYPKVRAEQLSAAREALAEESSRHSGELMVPAWLVRCSDPRRRIALFAAGGLLILVSFVFFGRDQQRERDEKPPTK